MTATDELRAELTKRGVEWNGKESTDVDNMTEWECGKTKAVAMEEDDGTLGLGATHLTPEQAIAATLGAGTCHNVHEPPKDTTFWPAPHFKCSECGATHVSMEYVFYCPNCGRKVVDE